MPDKGYVNYLEILELDESARPGDVRKNYKRLMKDLVMEIARVEITQERRDRYLLGMAKLNAAFYILRDNESRDVYWQLRKEVMALENEWRNAVDAVASNTDAVASTTDAVVSDTNAVASTTDAVASTTDAMRRTYDAKLRHFLSRYVEETMLEAGRDKECVEASNWDAAHERHASRLLRHYRQSLYQQILERLPYFEVTPPRVDWDERTSTIAAILSQGGA